MKKSEVGILGLVVTDGMGFRNFILSDFLSCSLKAFKKVIIYSALPKEVFTGLAEKNLEIIELPLYKESFFSWFFKKILEVVHLKNYQKDSYGKKENLKKSFLDFRSRRGWVIRLISALATFRGVSIVELYYQLQKRTFKNSPFVALYNNILQQGNPELLFFSHQRPAFLGPLCYSAEAMGIKTCSFIFSWDNISSKGNMATRFQSYLVWSSLMRDELHYFYPNTKNLKVLVTGTPQFELHTRREISMEKEEFHRKHLLNPALKTICYSCGDVSTSKNDPYYISLLARIIIEGKLGEKTNLLVRTSPAEDGARFKEVALAYPFVSWNFPNWELIRENHPEPWSQRVPKPVDLREHKALLENCDLNVNMCSTMGLDFMLFNKPVVNAVFGDGTNGLYNDQKYLKFLHYERVIRSGAVAVAKNEVELIREIRLSLNHPKARLKEQRKLLDLVTERAPQGTSLRVVQALKKIMNS